jgi:hypothetical protein
MATDDREQAEVIQWDRTPLPSGFEPEEVDWELAPDGTSIRIISCTSCDAAGNKVCISTFCVANGPYGRKVCKTVTGRFTCRVPIRSMLHP